jgi:hypothetical protein
VTPFEVWRFGAGFPQEKYPTPQNRCKRNTDMSKVHLNFPALSPEEKKKRRGRPFEPGNTIGKAVRKAASTR